MPQTPCFSSYFPSPGLLIGSGSQGILRLVTPHFGLWTLPNTGRPFVPIAGVVPHATIPNTYVPDTLANNVLFKAAFVQFAQAAFDASTNFSTDALVGNTITNSPFQGYLYKKLTTSPTVLARYYNIYSMVEQFYATAGAWTAEVFYAKLTDLQNKIAAQADKDLYIPNGDYTFINSVGSFGATLDTWKAASPNFYGMVGVEIYI